VEEQQDLNYNKLKTIANEKKGSDMSTMAKITASNMVTEIQKKKKKKSKVKKMRQCFYLLRNASIKW
jgi:hypothetical protein